MRTATNPTHHLNSLKVLVGVCFVGSFVILILLNSNSIFKDEVVQSNFRMEPYIKYVVYITFTAIGVAVRFCLCFHPLYQVVIFPNHL